MSRFGIKTATLHTIDDLCSEFDVDLKDRTKELFLEFKERKIQDAKTKRAFFSDEVLVYSCFYTAAHENCYLNITIDTLNKKIREKRHLSNPVGKLFRTIKREFEIQGPSKQDCIDWYVEQSPEEIPEPVVARAREIVEDLTWPIDRACAGTALYMASKAKKWRQGTQKYFGDLGKVAASCMARVIKAYKTQ